LIFRITKSITVSSGYDQEYQSYDKVRNLKILLEVKLTGSLMEI